MEDCVAPRAARVRTERVIEIILVKKRRVDDWRWTELNSGGCLNGETMTKARAVGTVSGSGFQRLIWRNERELQCKKPTCKKSADEAYVLDWMN